LQNSILPNPGKSREKRSNTESIVREPGSIRTLKPPEKRARVETVLRINANRKTEILKIVVCVQENESRRILGVGKLAAEKR